ncbi:mevalonate kinase [Streptomyces sp. WAC07149]|uniref:mevalonate kinase n=1 Tax=Streptomyces sp. WAC07149 TaxID=2487425 RepID=UPI000F7ABD26|nr:mevalonate kinase [Streptomyces sp. WAC07149]RST08987.1 mevalonate kinase [Streptomyces sp. WAC07149]
MTADPDAPAHTIRSAPEHGRTGAGRAHAKAILLGEHAVVYGAPAVALPLPGLTCTASAVFIGRPGHGLAGYRYRDPAGATAEDEAGAQPPQALRYLVEKTVERFCPGEVFGVDLVLENGIPVGRGLGSSAACARATVKALDGLLRLRLSASDVFDLVQLAETQTHGRSSGIDALATGSTRPVLLAGGRASAPRVGSTGWVVVADSGEFGSTREAVALVRDVFRRRPGREAGFVSRSGTLTARALEALAHGRLDLVGTTLTDTHRLLASLGLSTPALDRLVGAALEHGALGAKLSGGGMGGCVIALADTAEAATGIAAELTRQGARGTWTASIAERGEDD